MTPSFSEYSQRLNTVLCDLDEQIVLQFCQRLLTAWVEGQQVFICGNGGSGGNAAHIANDLMYGIDRKTGKGLKAHALTVNSSILTCLANDEGYEQIFAKQLAVYADKDDLLLVLSGSGNSPNILKALEYANTNGMDSFAILGYSGGAAKNLAKQAIHFPINDMQISEDTQLIVTHYAMQWLARHAKTRSSQ